jgi:hypothetical protein
MLLRQVGDKTSKERVHTKIKNPHSSRYHLKVLNTHRNKLFKKIIHTNRDKNMLFDYND